MNLPESLLKACVVTIRVKELSKNQWAYQHDFGIHQTQHVHPAPSLATSTACQASTSSLVPTPFKALAAGAVGQLKPLKIARCAKALRLSRRMQLVEG